MDVYGWYCGATGAVLGVRQLNLLDSRLESFCDMCVCRPRHGILARLKPVPVTKLSTRYGLHALRNSWNSGPIFPLLPLSSSYAHLSLQPGYQTWIPSTSLSLPLSSLPLVVASTSKVQAFDSHQEVCRSPMKNSSRTKCRGFACGGGKPGFWHVCEDCGKRFCPKCVHPCCKHACIPPEPPAGSSDDKSELRSNEPVDITRSEL